MIWLDTVSKMTNFGRITESPEKMAGFLHENYADCYECPMSDSCDSTKTCKDAMLEWLKEESDE